MWKKYIEATKFEAQGINHNITDLSKSIIFYADLKMFVKVAEISEIIAIISEDENTKFKSVFGCALNYSYYQETHYKSILFFKIYLSYIVQKNDSEEITFIIDKIMDLCSLSSKMEFLYILSKNDVNLNTSNYLYFISKCVTLKDKIFTKKDLIEPIEIFLNLLHQYLINGDDGCNSEINLLINNTTTLLNTVKR